MPARGNSTYLELSTNDRSPFMRETAPGARLSNLGRTACVVLAVATVTAVSDTTSAQLPDHPIITEVYTDPPGDNDAPVGRNAANEHQEYIEIYLPPAPSLSAPLNKDALRLTFYEVEGDTSSSGTGLVNYRFDLPTFDLDPSNGITPGAIERPSSGVVVMGWVDYVGNPPTALAGTPSTRVALINDGVTATNEYTFIAINGQHFAGTINFPTLQKENMIDLPNEASSGVIQNGSGVYLLVNRDSAGYVELCDDQHELECPAGSDPNLPNNLLGLHTSALLDGFAANDDSNFLVNEQPYSPPTGNDIDMENMLPAGGAFSPLVAQVPEWVSDEPAPGQANGYARRFVNVAKTTESALSNDPSIDAGNAYRHVRNVGPFFPSPGRAALTTSAAELGVAALSEQVVDVLAQTTGRPGLLCANVGGNFGINISASGGSSSNPSVATFAPGLTVASVSGQSYGFPSVAITVPASAADGATASATVNVSAVNSAGGPAVVAPNQSAMITVNVLKPTQGRNAAGAPFQATVFAAVQTVPSGAALNELLSTDLGEFVSNNFGGLALDTLGNGALLISGTTNLAGGPTMDALVETFPDLTSEYINIAAPPGRLSLVQTVSQSAEVLSGAPTYDGNITATGIKAIRLNTPDTQTFGGTFSPTEMVHFVDSNGFPGHPRSGLTNATTSRTFELAIIDTNVRLDGSIETGATDDFGIIVQVLDTEPGASVVSGEFVFLSYTGGLQGADIDTLDLPPHNNVANIIFLDLDNLHSVLGIRSVELIVLVDGSGTGEVDVVEVFSLNPVGALGCTTNPQCDDGLFCNGVESCVGNVCQPGAPIDCDDQVSCTTDACNEATDGCDNVPMDIACDNGLFCDGAETCDPVQDCLPGVPVDCDDAVLCTGDSCDEQADQCAHLPDDGTCDNGLFCDGTETCDPELGCMAGDPPCGGQPCDEISDTCTGCSRNGECDDDNECTDDVCESQACVNTPVTDGTECAAGLGVCEGGICQIIGGCTSNADCDDEIVCTFDQCVAGQCTNIAAEFGDLASPAGACGPDGTVNIFDILMVLDGFQGQFAPGCAMHNIDITGSTNCLPDGVVNIFDIFAVLDAFQGLDPCECP